MQRLSAIALTTPLLLLTLPSPSFAGGPPAAQTEQSVENAIPKLKTWKQLHALHLRFPHTDDGATAEEYSDFVVHTLAKHWDSLGQLQTIATADPAFETFVLSHIDATADTHELKSVLHNATHRRPKGAQRLCREIETAARDAVAHS